jgi:hypothetical protein
MASTDEDWVDVESQPSTSHIRQHSHPTAGSDREDGSQTSASNRSGNDGDPWEFVNILPVSTASDVIVGQVLATEKPLKDEGEADLFITSSWNELLRTHPGYSQMTDDTLRTDLSKQRKMVMYHFLDNLVGNRDYGISISAYMCSEGNLCFNFSTGSDGYLLQRSVMGLPRSDG